MHHTNFGISIEICEVCKHLLLYSFQIGHNHEEELALVNDGHISFFKDFYSSKFISFPPEKCVIHTPFAIIYVYAYIPHECNLVGKKKLVSHLAIIYVLCECKITPKESVIQAELSFPPCNLYNMPKLTFSFRNPKFTSLHMSSTKYLLYHTLLLWYWPL